LYDSLYTEFPKEKISFIMAVMADKDYLSMAKIMAPIARRIYTVTVESDRALQAKELAKAIGELGIDAKSCDSYQDALNQALLEDERIVAFGSLYFIGEVLGMKG
jgi:dihydrofolate synthase/folylpolyglutamate synthase